MRYATRIMDKSKEYDLYSVNFRKNFKGVYFLDNTVENPFKIKDNLYMACESGEEFIGGVNVLFLKSDTYLSMLTGRLIDDMKISRDEVVYLADVGEINAYVSTVFVNSDFRNSGYGKILLLEAIAEVKALSEGRPCRFIALCISKTSEKLFESIGFSRILKNASGDVVMEYVVQTS